MNLKRISIIFVVCILACILTSAPAATSCLSAADRPNILFAIADDWGWPHAGAYEDPVVKTPAFDRLAKEGILFRHAYISSPSCTPSRGAILMGQYHWELGGAGNLYGTFLDSFETYPDILSENGYQVGCSSKCWGPGKTETPGREPGGKRYKNFQEFFEQRDQSKPFCYWLGSTDPHRGYKAGSGKASGMDLSKIKLPACFPDHETVRSDVADYYFEVQRFDSLVQQAIDALEKSGELNNTLIVMTGDHGMPFPRCKSNLYDTGARVPLAARWPKGISKPRETHAFVSTIDLAPTFLEIAGVAIPERMSGNPLVGLFNGDEAGRDQIVFGKERHVPSQEAPDSGGYPGRAIRTKDFLFIRNYEVDRWPNGTPAYEKAFIPGAWFGDTDNGPTKTFMVQHKDDDAHHRRLYDLSFAKCPAVELFDLKNDPDQLNNVANKSQNAETVQTLEARLTAALAETDDPRVKGNGKMFDEFPYSGGAPKHPDWQLPQEKKSPIGRPKTTGRTQ